MGEDDQKHLLDECSRLLLKGGRKEMVGGRYQVIDCGW